LEKRAGPSKQTVFFETTYQITAGVTDAAEVASDVVATLDTAANTLAPVVAARAGVTDAVAALDTAADAAAAAAGFLGARTPCISW
jgi:hypothetical protein